MASKSIVQEFTKGIWLENPVLRLLLGLCPTLAVTSSVENGLGMGGASTFVLVSSNIVVSLLKKVIPPKMRIPCFIVIIAAFVTIVDMVLKAYMFELSKSLGLFVPLIVVNCIILGRAEAFAYKQGLGRSIIDGLGMGVGFTLALMAIGAVREVLGDGKLLGMVVMPESFPKVIVMVLAPGAFLTLGFLVAGMNWITQSKDAKARERRRIERRNKASEGAV